jgi:7-cyano-7-deazaguanine synthase
METERTRAVILLSGGIDSTTSMAIAKHEGFDLYGLSFRYGQRHLRELDMAKKVAEYFGARRHIVVDFDMRTIGGSALVDGSEVPKGRSIEEIQGTIPVTYVPARNTIFLAFALAWAEVIGALDIFMGVTAVDFSGYPDCRPEFIRAFQEVAKLGTRLGVEGEQLRIHTPLIHMTKAEIIRKGTDLGVDYSMTHSCYDPTPDRRACGWCDSCILRQKGFREAGLIDPIEYAGG